MKNLQRYLQDVANARRQELLPFVFAHTQGRVQTGPFKGVTLLPQYMWGDGDTAAKLLGVYENELHEFVESAIAAAPDAVINVGCAEGYYSIGLAHRLKTVGVLAIDIDARSAAIVQTTAEANQLNNVAAITQTVDAAWLQSQCSQHRLPFVVMDCEGAELELLSLDQVPALAHSLILVESHDCINPSITSTLIERFGSTHTIQTVSQTVKDAYQFEFLQGLSDCDKWALVHEGRPSTMSWLYMVPVQ
jgi:ribosomal protein L11 methylase PrmA